MNQKKKLHPFAPLVIASFLALSSTVAFARGTSRNLDPAVTKDYTDFRRDKEKELAEIRADFAEIQREVERGKLDQKHPRGDRIMRRIKRNLGQAQQRIEDARYSTEAMWDAVKNGVEKDLEHLRDSIDTAEDFYDVNV